MAKFGDTEITQAEELGGISILATVADQIKTLNPRVEEAVVDTLVEREIEKRSHALVILLDRIAVLEKELKKIKPDQLTFKKDGTLISESWSKNQLETRNKTEGKIKKITDAINKALIEKDFSNVYQLANEKEGGGDSNKKDPKTGGNET